MSGDVSDAKQTLFNQSIYQNNNEPAAKPKKRQQIRVMRVGDFNTSSSPMKGPNTSKYESSNVRQDTQYSSQTASRMAQRGEATRANGVKALANFAITNSKNYNQNQYYQVKNDKQNNSRLSHISKLSKNSHRSPPIKN